MFQISNNSKILKFDTFFKIDLGVFKIDSPKILIIVYVFMVLITPNLTTNSPKMFQMTYKYPEYTPNMHNIPYMTSIYNNYI